MGLLSKIKKAKSKSLGVKLASKSPVLSKSKLLQATGAVNKRQPRQPIAKPTPSNPAGRPLGSRVGGLRNPMEKLPTRTTGTPNPLQIGYETGTPLEKVSVNKPAARVKPAARKMSALAGTTRRNYMR